MRTPVTGNEGMMCEVPASGKHAHWELVPIDLLNSRDMTGSMMKGWSYFSAARSN